MNEKKKLVCIFSPTPMFFSLTKEARVDFEKELIKIEAERLWWNSDMIFFFDEKYLSKLEKLSKKYNLDMKIEYPEE